MNEEVIKAEETTPIAPATKKRQSPPPIELLYCQVYDMFDSKIYGFESQIRINNKKLGTLTPELFVPIAERSNQIVELGKWSFVEMSDMIRRQREKGRAIPRMFMPVSVKYFCKRYFADNVARQTQKANMQPNEVCIMLRSSDILEHANEVKDAVVAVREQGFQVALTGVGGEGLSLTQMSEIEMDYLRFDAGFVAQLVNNERAKDIANTFGTLATSLKAQLMADGVETKEQVEALQSIGCSLMQGAYISEFERENQMF